MRILWMALVAIFGMAQVSQATLIGTELSLETIFQSTPSSSVNAIGFLTTATVREPGVEFPSLSATQVSNPPLGLQLVNVAINSGNNFIEIDFDNSAPFTSFASAFRNSYVFTFDNAAMPSIEGASIDRSVTTLGLSDSDLRFSLNKLEVNVEGLSFSSSSFARVNLTVEGGPSNPVPEPATVWLFVAGLAALLAYKKKSKTSA